MNRIHGVLGKRVISIIHEKMWNPGGQINFTCLLEFQSSQISILEILCCCFFRFHDASILFFFLFSKEKEILYRLDIVEMLYMK